MFITKLLASLLLQSTQKYCNNPASQTTNLGGGATQTISVDPEGGFPPDGASINYEVKGCC